MSNRIAQKDQGIERLSSTDDTVLTNLPNDVIRHHMFTYLTDIELANIGSMANERISILSKQPLQGKLTYPIISIIFPQYLLPKLERIWETEYLNTTRIDAMFVKLN